MNLKNKYLPIALPLSYLLILVSSVSAEVFFSIDNYMIGRQDQFINTPINGVFNISKEKLESYECVQSIKSYKKDLIDKDFSDCKQFMVQLLDKERKGIAELFQCEADEDCVYIEGIAILETGKIGQTYLYKETNLTGSGGGEKFWSLHLIHKNEIGQLSFFSRDPFMSGIEVIPGGNTWYEFECQGEDYDKCTERLLYPKKNAFQFLFTDEGIIAQPLK